MAKLVDAPDLGSGVLRRVGSSPIRRTMKQKEEFSMENSSFCFWRKSEGDRDLLDFISPRFRSKQSVLDGRYIYEDIRFPADE